MAFVIEQYFDCITNFRLITDGTTARQNRSILDDEALTIAHGFHFVGDSSIIRPFQSGQFSTVTLHQNSFRSGSLQETAALTVSGMKRPPAAARGLDCPLSARVN